MILAAITKKPQRIMKVLGSGPRSGAWPRSAATRASHCAMIWKGDSSPLHTTPYVDPTRGALPITSTGTRLSEPHPARSIFASSAGLRLALALATLLAVSATGCLSRTRAPGLPFVEPAQSVPQVDPARLQIVARMEALETDLQRLRDQVERLQVSGADQNAIRELQNRVAFIERQLGMEQTAPARGEFQPPGAVAPSAVGGQAPGRPPQISHAPVPGVPLEIRNEPLSEEEQAFRQAYTLVREGSFDQAIGLLDAFLKRYPKSRFAVNAVYWTGEAHFAAGRFNEAVLQFDRVIKEFPGSEKEPSALLKQGQSFEKMGDRQSARIIFDKLVKEYPHTTQARLVRNRLKSLPQN